MKKLISVIGDPNFGKSTIIRSFTGFEFAALDGRVTDTSNGRYFHVFSASPQERETSIENIETILNTIENDPLGIGVVLALQPRRTRSTDRPRMESCIALFQGRANWEVYNFFIAISHDGVNSRFSEIEINNMLRNVGASLITPSLDARQFVLINSNIIQAASLFF